MSYQIIEHKHDILIVGAGGAGLMAAIKSARLGFDVAVFVRWAGSNRHVVVSRSRKFDRPWPSLRHPSLPGCDSSKI